MPSHCLLVIGFGGRIFVSSSLGDFGNDFGAFVPVAVSMAVSHALFARRSSSTSPMNLAYVSTSWTV